MFKGAAFFYCRDLSHLSIGVTLQSIDAPLYRILKKIIYPWIIYFHITDQ